MARREKQLNSLSIKAEKYKCGEIQMCEKKRECLKVKLLKFSW